MPHHIIVVDAQIGVDDPVSRSDDFAPMDFGVGVPYCNRNVRRCFTDKLEIVQGRVIRASIGDKCSLVHSCGIREYDLAALDHVTDIETPTRPSRPSSDMDGLPFDLGLQRCSQRLVSDQIDRATYQVFYIELHAKISLRRRRAVESHEDVDVAVIDVLIACE